MPSRCLKLAVAALLFAGTATALPPPADAAQRKQSVRAAACTPGTFRPEARVGGKCCFSDGHLHYGSSGSESSKDRAIKGAIRSWADFVAWEYGGTYRNFNIAITKQMTCSNGGSGWSCSVSATPCR